jgi:hypothetical protein
LSDGFPHPDVRTLPLSLYELIYTHLGVPVLLFGLVLVAGQTSFLLLFPWYYNIVVRDRHNIKAVHATVVQCVHIHFCFSAWSSLRRSPLLCRGWLPCRNFRVRYYGRFFCSRVRPICCHTTDT